MKGIQFFDKNSTSSKAALFFLVGLLFSFAVKLFWGYFSMVNPLFYSLLSCCAGSDWFRSVIFIQDVLINIILCAPVVWLLLKYAQTQIWLYAAIVLLPSFLYSNSFLFWPEHFSTLYLSGWFLELCCLPTALLFWLTVKKYRSS